MAEHEKYMHRCLELASKGLGNVAPNPLVGAVLVKDGKIIGEGYHQQYGKAHAEVNAVDSFLNLSGGDTAALSKATMYVNLEPCNHQGKTPPCTELIIRHKIPEVIIGCGDPNKRAGINGAEALIKSGCKVIQGVLQKESEELNRRFITYHTKRRPYIILKYAQSRDGFIAPEKNSGRDSWLTNEWSRKLVHKWRSEEPAIMVGTNTAAEDNPMLTTRYWSGRNPLRIVIDRKLRLPSSLNIFNPDAVTIIFNGSKNLIASNIEFVQINFKETLNEILRILYAREIQSIIIEGGAKLLQSFLEKNLWDEVRVFTADKYFINGIQAPQIPGGQISEENIEGNMLSVFRNTFSAAL
jgi:diaminohydroxyphosphoribosylaminopyrimidine deaminase/5-amino-6-(5-phosphoribosylamino)uracil reductase